MKIPEQKLREFDTINISELLSFRNNPEQLLEAYKNGNLCAICYDPISSNFIIDDQPDIETVIKDNAVGFYIKHQGEYYDKI